MEEKEVKLSDNNTPAASQKGWVVVGAILAIIVAVFLGVRIAGRISSQNEQAQSGTTANKKESELAKAYKSCVKSSSTEASRIDKLSDTRVIVAVRIGDEEQLSEAKCIVEELGKFDVYQDAVNALSKKWYVGVEEMDFDEYKAQIRIDRDYDDSDDSILYMAIYSDEEDQLETAVEVCNEFYQDKGELEPHYMYKNYSDYEKARDSYKTYGKLKLEDNGRTLEYSAGKSSYTSTSDSLEKRGCVYRILGVPKRIQTAISNTAAIDGRQKDSFGNYIIEWSYRNDTSSMTIYEEE
ncbi:hypothetical protein IJH97_02685 [Candidatus Saccharibacteria bacterium]|nr:hypothetical protein [Candidatus Saccharibacteria bacterium]